MFYLTWMGGLKAGYFGGEGGGSERVCTSGNEVVRFHRRPSNKICHLFSTVIKGEKKRKSVCKREIKGGGGRQESGGRGRSMADLVVK